MQNRFDKEQEAPIYRQTERQTDKLEVCSGSTNRQKGPILQLSEILDKKIPAAIFTEIGTRPKVSLII